MVKNSKNACFVLIFTVFCLTFALFSPLTFSKPVFATNEKSELTSAKSMMVLERSTLRPLYYHNENERLPMASTTKIITAIYVIENTGNLDKVFEIPEDAVGIEGTSIGLKRGEHLTIRELLYGLMLRSGNDSAVALAIATSGSEKAFVAGVNNFLQKKGFKDTKLANAHGLPNDEHYTTASDLARITAYALSNPTFAEIVSTKEKRISNELKTKYSRNLINKNKLLTNYEFADGVKTGYTRKAGRCFVGSATKGGMNLICVLLNCNPMFEECQELLERGFSEYKMYKLLSKEDKLGKITIQKSNTKNIDLYSSRDFSYPLRRDELKDVYLTVNHASKLAAPIKDGEPLAEVEIKIKNQLIFSDKIYNI